LPKKGGYTKGDKEHLHVTCKLVSPLYIGVLHIPTISSS